MVVAEVSTAAAVEASITAVEVSTAVVDPMAVVRTAGIASFKPVTQLEVRGTVWNVLRTSRLLQALC